MRRSSGVNATRFISIQAIENNRSGTQLLFMDSKVFGIVGALALVAGVLGYNYCQSKKSRGPSASIERVLLIKVLEELKNQILASSKERPQLFKSGAEGIRIKDVLQGDAVDDSESGIIAVLKDKQKLVLSRHKITMDQFREAVNTSFRDDKEVEKYYDEMKAVLQDVSKGRASLSNVPGEMQYGHSRNQQSGISQHFRQEKELNAAPQERDASQAVEKVIKIQEKVEEKPQHTNVQPEVELKPKIEVTSSVEVVGQSDSKTHTMSESKDTNPLVESVFEPVVAQEAPVKQEAPKQQVEKLNTVQDKQPEVLNEAKGPQKQPLVQSVQESGHVETTETNQIQQNENNQQNQVVSEPKGVDPQQQQELQNKQPEHSNPVVETVPATTEAVVIESASVPVVQSPEQVKQEDGKQTTQQQSINEQGREEKTQQKQEVKVETAVPAAQQESAEQKAEAKTQTTTAAESEQKQQAVSTEQSEVKKEGNQGKRKNKRRH